MATTEWRIDLREKCARCGHAWSFHGKAMETTCRAMGCKGGQDKTRCPGFVVDTLSDTW